MSGRFCSPCWTTHRVLATGQPLDRELSCQTSGWTLVYCRYALWETFTWRKWPLKSLIYLLRMVRYLPEGITNLVHGVIMLYKPTFTSLGATDPVQHFPPSQGRSPVARTFVSSCISWWCLYKYNIPIVKGWFTNMFFSAHEVQLYEGIYPHEP